VLCTGPSHLIHQVNPLYGQLLIYQVHISIILGVLLIYKLYQPYAISTDISVSAVCTSLHMHVLQLTRGLQVGTALLHRSAPELQGAETHLLGTK
jgi:hypothetical protein